MWFALLVLVQACTALRVTVVGGSGFVGSRVCRALVAKDGVEVTSVSKSGRVPAWAAGEPWAAAVHWAAVDLLNADDTAIDAAMASPEAIVSCVGVVDSNVNVLHEGNGEANVRAFASAKRAGVKRSVYVSVASEVAACESDWLPFAQDEFAAYFAGKRLAEEAAADAVTADATKLCVLKPTFIYGGESFELPLPGRFVAPRVSAAYGACVEELLSLPLFDALAEAMPGLIKVALRPPVSVEAVAAACAKGALGELTMGGATRRAVGTLDGTAAIRAASGEQAATPLADGLDRLLDRWGQLTEEFFEWVQRQLDGSGPKR